MKKKIIINLLVIFLILMCGEIWAYHHPNESLKTYVQNFNKNAGKEVLKFEYARVAKFNPNFYDFDRRPIIYGNKNKRPMIFIGGSFTNGALLEKEQTFSSKITQLTGRTTYNGAVGGYGPQNILYEIKNTNKYDSIKDAEYVVYTYINDHRNRIYSYLLSPFTQNNVLVANTRYEIKKGILQEVEPKFMQMYSSFIVRRIQDRIVYNKVQDEDESFKLLKSILDEIRIELKKNSPDLKFIVLLYKDTSKILPNQKHIDILKNDNYIVFDAEELAGHELVSEKWKAGDKEHPSAEVWKDIAPALVKELNL